MSGWWHGPRGEERPSGSARHDPCAHKRARVRQDDEREHFRGGQTETSGELLQVMTTNTWSRDDMASSVTNSRN